MSSPFLARKRISRFPRWLRRVLYLLASLFLLIVLYYWVERFRGHHALNQAVAAYEADGESLDMSHFLAKRPPDAENFGATPLLEGIMEPPDSDGIRSPRVTQMRKHLENLSPGEFDIDDIYGIRSYPPPSKSLRERERDKSAGVAPSPPPFPPGSINWAGTRGRMLREKRYSPPSGESSDVRAVYDAMNSEQAVFTELIGASARPYAVFTPAPADRGDVDEDKYRPIRSRISGWLVLLRLRAIAASILGRVDETVDIAGVFWKIRQAALVEPGLISWFGGSVAARHWMACARDVASSPGVTDSALRRLLDQPGEKWSPQNELLCALRSHAALMHDCWLKSLPEVEGTFFFGPKEYLSHGEQPTWRNIPVAGWCPAGWLSLSAAADLRGAHHFGIQTLRTSGFAGLPSSAAGASKEDEGWSFSTSLLRSGGMGNLLNAIVFDYVRLRQMQLALGMERYRLKNHVYPSDTGKLIPDCLSTIPPDIDGHPLHISTTPDGRSVIYSVGWNLADDWHGNLPAKYDETNHWQNADWAMALPFPPLPKP
jgi:hypothetical protein